MAYDPDFNWSRDSVNRLNRRTIPNVTVTDTEGRKFAFYHDLVKSRPVLIAFTSIEHDAHYPCTSKLNELRNLLDDGPASNFDILTVTVDPDTDSPRRWARYARSAGERPGWRFLHASADDTETLRAALYVNRGSVEMANKQRLWERADLLRMKPAKAVMHCSLGLLRYGREDLDIWAGVPVRAHARDIAQRLEVISSGLRRPDAGRRRAGPFRTNKI